MIKKIIHIILKEFYKFYSPLKITIIKPKRNRYFKKANSNSLKINLYNCNKMECQKLVKIIANDIYSKKIKRTPLLLNLSDYYDFFDYLKKIKKAKYHYKKALKNGCQFKEFNCENYSHSIIEIRQSKLFRTGGITPFFFSSNYFCRKEKFNCKIHWERYFGIFLKDNLVAYTKIRRTGNILKIIEFLGHKNYLTFNVMDMLWIKLVEMTLNRDLNYFENITYIYYGSAEHGSIGLARWKKKYGFQIYKI